MSRPCWRQDTFVLILGPLVWSIACTSPPHNEATVSATPDTSPRARLGEADKLYQQGNIADAASLYDSVAEVDPQAGDASQRALALSAAEKAVLCYQELTKDRLARAPAVAVGVPVPMRDNEAKLAHAAERLLKYVEDNKERASNVHNLLGRLYFWHNRLDEALTHLTEVVSEVPEQAIACQAAHLSLDIHNAREDYATLADAAQALATNDRLACTTQQKATFSQVAEQAAFKSIERTYQGNAKPQEAAEAYLRFAEQHPASDLSCAAIHNATVSYHAAKQPSDEARVRKLLSRRCGDWMKRNGF